MAIALVAGSSGPPVVIDASLWISNLLSTDPNHASAVNWVNQHLAGGGEFIAPVLIVAEIAGALARITQDRTTTRAWVQQFYLLRSLQLVAVDQQLAADAASFAIDFGLRGADAIYIALAKRLNIPLVTFDREQLTRPASIVTTIRP